MYARLCSATGWTWEYVGQCVTLPRLHAFLEYWRSVPPVAESVAAYLGVKPAATPATPGAVAANDAKARDEYIAAMPVRTVQGVR